MSSRDEEDKGEVWSDEKLSFMQVEVDVAYVVSCHVGDNPCFPSLFIFNVACGSFSPGFLKSFFPGF